MLIYPCLFWVLISLPSLNCHVIDVGGRDLTEAPGAVGEDVVDATLQKIGFYLNRDRKPIFLKRIALVESNFGLNQDVINSNPQGGIWQISSFIYSALLSNLSQSNSSFALLNDTQFTFNYECFLCSRNFSSPLRSALAALLFVDLNRGPIAESNVSEQARWWVTHYNEHGNESKFVQKSLEFDVNHDCKDEMKLDLYFLIDESPKISSHDFQSELNFISNFSSNFNVSKSQVQLGYSTYSYEEKSFFRFNQTDKFSAFNEVLRETKTLSVYTNTSKALLDVLDRSFSPSEGARPYVRKVLFVITDGSSVEDLATSIGYVEEAEITIVVIGIGRDVNETQLNQMAFDNKHLFHLNSFENLTDVRNMFEIYGQLCKTVFSGNIAEFIELELSHRKHSYDSASALEQSIVDVFGLSCFNCGDPESDAIVSLLEEVFAQHEKEIDVNLKRLLYKLILNWTHRAGYYEDEVRQNVSRFDWWFLLDSIPSYTEEEFQYSLNFISRMSRFFALSPERVQIGFSCSFQDKHHIFCSFQQCSSWYLLERALDNAVDPTSESNIGRSLQKVFDENFSDDNLYGARNNTDDSGKFLIVISRSKSSDSVFTVADDIHSSNIKVFVVGVGNYVNSTELQILASSPSPQFFYHVNNFSQLHSLIPYMHALVHRRMNDDYCNKVIQIEKNQKVTVKLGEGERRKTISMHLKADDVVILNILSQLDALNASGFFSSVNEEPNQELYDMAVVLDQQIEEFVINGSSLADRYFRDDNGNLNRRDELFPFYFTIRSTKSFSTSQQYQGNTDSSTNLSQNNDVSLGAGDSSNEDSDDTDSEGPDTNLTTIDPQRVYSDEASIEISSVAEQSATKSESATESAADSSTSSIPASSRRTAGIHTAIESEDSSEDSDEASTTSQQQLIGTSLEDSNATNGNQEVTQLYQTAEATYQITQLTADASSETKQTVEQLQLNDATITMVDSPNNSRQTAGLILFWVVIAFMSAGVLLALFSLVVLLLIKVKKRKQKQIRPSAEEFHEHNHAHRTKSTERSKVADNETLLPNSVADQLETTLANLDRQFPVKKHAASKQNLRHAENVKHITNQRAFDDKSLKQTAINHSNAIANATLLPNHEHKNLLHPKSVKKQHQPKNDKETIDSENFSTEHEQKKKRAKSSRQKDIDKQNNTLNTPQDSLPVAASPKTAVLNSPQQHKAENALAEDARDLHENQTVAKKVDDTSHSEKLKQKKKKRHKSARIEPAPANQNDDQRRDAARSDDETRQDLPTFLEEGETIKHEGPHEQYAPIFHDNVKLAKWQNLSDDSNLNPSDKAVAHAITNNDSIPKSPAPKDRSKLVKDVEIASTENEEHHEKQSKDKLESKKKSKDKKSEQTSVSENAENEQKIKSKHQDTSIHEQEIVEDRTKQSREKRKKKSKQEEEQADALSENQVNTLTTIETPELETPSKGKSARKRDASEKPSISEPQLGSHKLDETKSVAKEKTRVFSSESKEVLSDTTTKKQRKKLKRSYSHYSGEELKKKMKVLLNTNPERYDLKEVTKALENHYAGEGDQEVESLLADANKKFQVMQKQHLVLEIQQALTVRTHESITNALVEVDLLLEDGMEKSAIEGDHGLKASVDKASRILKIFEKIRKSRDIIVALEPSDLEHLCDYTKPPPEVRNVLEASFILLGEDQEKLIGWKVLQALVRKPGADGVQQRMINLNNSSISKYDFQKVTDLLSDLQLEDVIEENEVAAAFYQWIHSVMEEVADRHNEGKA